MPARVAEIARVLPLLGLFLAAPASADSIVGTPAVHAPAIHALVVGVDAYIRPLSVLEGARADARDIADALRGIGVRPEVLLDGAANRRAILDGLDALIAKAAPGDIVLFSYAGHGGLSTGPSRDATEATGRDQWMLLGGFTAQAPGNAERIVDDEIFLWSRRATARGLRVVTVFDACHSGTLYRSVDPRAGGHVVRGAEFEITGEDALPDLPVVASQAPPDGVFSYAAAKDNEEVPESFLQGRRRGAFSIAFAEALRGKADADGDGWVAHGELRVYLTGRTRSMSDGRQTPRMEPEFAHLDERLFRTGAVAVSSPAGVDVPVRLRMLGGGAPRAPVEGFPVEGVEGVTLIDDPRAPVDLVWDAGRGEAVSANGDVVALDLTGDRLGGLIRKWRALRLLDAAPGAALVMRAVPDDRAFVDGEPFGFMVENVGGQALTMFNLAGDGTVQFLYPKFPRDARMITGAYRLDDTTVRAPFGADHVVAVTTSEIPNDLHETLRRLDGRSSPVAAVEAVEKALRGDPKARKGVQAIISRPK